MSTEKLKFENEIKPAITLSDIQRCPIKSLDPEHYDENGLCKCGMAVNEDARGATVLFIRDMVRQYRNREDAIIKEMENARTEEEIMRHKKDLLLTMLHSLPIGLHCCYFCNLSASCGECPYRRLHGQCSHKESDFHKFHDAVDSAVEALERYSCDSDNYRR